MLQTPFKWTDQNTKIMRDMIAAGLAGSVIAGRLGCSRNAVIGKANRLGLSVGKRGRGAQTTAEDIIVESEKRQRWTPERLQRAAALIKGGLIVRRVAEIMDVSYAAMKMAAQKYKEYFPRREKHVPEEVESARERFEGGRLYQHAGRSIRGSTPLRFEDTPTGRCKWPLTNLDDPDGPDMPCCGIRTGHLGSYCKTHAFIAYGRVK